MLVLNLLAYAVLFSLTVYTLTLYYRAQKKDKGTAAQLWTVCLTSLYVMIHDMVMILFMFQCDFFRLAEPTSLITGSYEDLQITWTVFIVPMFSVFFPTYCRMKA